jgi:signal transduction histidine kinase
MSFNVARFSRLLGLAVHEIRTPVGVVSGYVTMLLKEQAGPLNERQRKMLEEAAKSCGRLATLAQEMSAFRSIEMAEAQFKAQNFDLAALLAEVASRMHDGEDRGVRFELRGTDRPVLVTGDRTRLAEALTTLMHVAVRERGDPGVIVAQCSTVDGGGAAYAMVAFADESLLPALTETGAAESLAFDDFRGGTGYRLPLVRSVVERHGGAIWSAATSEELDILNAELRSEKNRLSYTERGELARKRAAAALRLPLQT